MLEAVFISDLHLHPNEPLITERFNQFVDWALLNTKNVYILGDFFHAWPGDDALDAWSLSIVQQLKKLSQAGLSVFFMHGNRDFLIGTKLIRQAGMTLLNEPTIIQLANMPVLLVHGDRYCLLDKSHQRFRRFTRNKWFSRLFLRLPFNFRNRLVAGVREFSQANRKKEMTVMDVVPEAMLAHMETNKVMTLIHGHTHKPGLTQYDFKNAVYKQYILSDWDESPQLLCYHNTKGLYYIQS